MGRVKASEWHLNNSSTVAAWAQNESETAMKDDFEEEACVTKSELEAIMSKMLRIVLGSSNNGPIIHSTLRSKALAGAEGDLRYAFLSVIK
jgi:hypothetical protein